MSEPQKFPVFWLGLRILVGFFYFYAGWTKIMAPIADFQYVIESYGIIPPVLVLPIAYVLPWLELLFGLFLGVGYLTRISAGVIGLISMGFVLLMSVTFWRTGAFPADCGCFGEQSWLHFSGADILKIDLLTCVICLRLVFSPRPWGSLDRWLLSFENEGA